jgi:Linalool dehydratase/isomerase
MKTPEALAMLDDRQAGHLRHFANLSRRPINDWSLMHGRGTGQDDFGGYRFQMAYMAYAMALAHRHRLPAAPGVFQPVFESFIEKMLLPEVWMYWARVSRGGSVLNAHLSDKYTEDWNPVGRDNIMYSAYVQSMALLYNYLFDDDRYAKQGALTFKYWSFFWGGQERRFEYDQKSLNDNIYWQMVESGYLGVACEPNCVFQICNQPAILGFRMHDLVSGSAIAEEVTQGYQKAWEQFGHLGANGHYNAMISQDTRAVRDNAGQAPWIDAWCGTLMNMWNREFVHTHYPAQIAGWLIREPEGMLSVRSLVRPEVMGQKVVIDDSDFGWAATWASEMGDASMLDGLLKHAERFMAPTWLDDGFYYPRNDVTEDVEGHRTLVEPMMGNVLLGYARLNVPDGFWRLYNEPWPASHHTDPALVRVGTGVDVLRAHVDHASRSLRFSLRRAPMSRGGFDVEIGRLASRGAWTLSQGGQSVAQGIGASVRRSNAFDVQASECGIALTCPEAGAVDFEMTFASGIQ